MILSVQLLVDYVERMVTLLDIKLYKNAVDDLQFFMILRILNIQKCV